MRLLLLLIRSAWLAPHLPSLSDLDLVTLIAHVVLTFQSFDGSAEEDKLTDAYRQVRNRS